MVDIEINEDTKALILEWDPLTGKRAGGIDPRDQRLPCWGWQDLDAVPAIEIRLIEDDRDVEQYRDVEGITILEGIDAIDAAIEELFEDQIVINDKFFFEEHIRQKISTGELDIGDLPDDPRERLKELKEKHGIKGTTVVGKHKVKAKGDK